MDQIKHLYIEPTAHCNLKCKMCSRNTWQNESIGHMDMGTFHEIMDTMPESVTRIFFGGIGEPLMHPNILSMLKLAKETGRRVELITNGTLLTETMARDLLNLELAVLWISIDSFEKASYDQIRLGADYSNVMENIRRLGKIHLKKYPYFRHHDTGATKLGIAFVLMKNNLDQYRKLLEKSSSLGISYVKATHLIPYSKEQSKQNCYEKMLGVDMYNVDDAQRLSVDMPLLDMQDMNEHGLSDMLSNPSMRFSFMGDPLFRRKNYCRFTNEGYTFVRWDGEICPCMALLHDAITYPRGNEHRVRFASFGNTQDNGIKACWHSEDYTNFRRRVNAFDFSPCSNCGVCGDFAANETDCGGSPFPACGACLWAQGIYQCP